VSTRKELKLWLDVATYRDIAARIVRAGGKFLGKADATFVYFNQPPGKVLKLTKLADETRKTVIEKSGDQFVIVSSEPVAQPAQLEVELTQKYGVKRELTNHQAFFSFGNYELSVNEIEGVGNVLVIEGENPTISVVTKLGIETPHTITQSFDNL
jgi:hypothetical protein